MSDDGGLRIVGLGGSLGKISRSRSALRVALEGAAAAGAQTDFLDLRELDLPMYNPDHEEPGESAAELIEACYDADLGGVEIHLRQSADGLVWSSPLYQGTISGALKNAIDWLHPLGRREPPYLHDKVIGLISTAAGTQGLQAINTMEFATRALRGWAVPYVVPVASAARIFDAEGRIQDQAVESQLEMLGREVVRVAELSGAQNRPDHAAECERAVERVAAAA